MLSCTTLFDRFVFLVRSLLITIQKNVVDFSSKNGLFHYANANKNRCLILVFSIRPIYFSLSLSMNCVTLSCRSARPRKSHHIAKVNWSAGIRHATQSHSHSKNIPYSYSHAFTYSQCWLFSLFVCFFFSWLYRYF